MVESVLQKRTASSADLDSSYSETGSTDADLVTVVSNIPNPLTSEAALKGALKMLHSIELRHSVDQCLFKQSDTVPIRIVVPYNNDADESVFKFVYRQSNLSAKTRRCTFTDITYMLDSIFDQVSEEVAALAFELLHAAYAETQSALDRGESAVSYDRVRFILQNYLIGETISYLPVRTRSDPFPVEKKLVIDSWQGDGDNGVVVSAHSVDRPSRVYAVRFDLLPSDDFHWRLEFRNGLLSKLSKLERTDGWTGFPFYYGEGSCDGFYYIVVELLGQRLDGFRDDSRDWAALPQPSVRFKAARSVVMLLYKLHGSGYCAKTATANNLVFQRTFHYDTANVAAPSAAQDVRLVLIDFDKIGPITSICLLEDLLDGLRAVLRKSDCIELKDLLREMVAEIKVDGNRRFARDSNGAPAVYQHVIDALYAAEQMAETAVASRAVAPTVTAP